MFNAINYKLTRDENKILFFSYYFQHKRLIIRSMFMLQNLNILGNK